jgi:hypothetical protein
MLGDGGLGEGKLVHDVAAHAGGSMKENAKDLHPGRVTDGLGKRREFLVGLFSFDRAQVRLGVRRRAAVGGALSIHRKWTIRLGRVGVKGLRPPCAEIRSEVLLRRKVAPRTPRLAPVDIGANPRLGFADGR